MPTAGREKASGGTQETKTRRDGNRRNQLASTIKERNSRNCGLSGKTWPRPPVRSLAARLPATPTATATVKALVWFWLIDETLSANLVYQSDYEIGSTTPSDEAMAKIMTMVMAW